MHTGGGFFALPLNLTFFCPNRSEAFIVDFHKSLLGVICIEKTRISKYNIYYIKHFDSIQNVLCVPVQYIRKRKAQSVHVSLTS